MHIDVNHFLHASPRFCFFYLLFQVFEQLLQQTPFRSLGYLHPNLFFFLLSASKELLEQ
jgi:hypothetical protein